MIIGKILIKTNFNMKKLLTAIFCFIATLLFSQTYHFNYSLESKRFGPEKKDVWDFGSVFFDSKSNTKMSFYYDADQLKAILHDQPREMTHLYNVEAGKENTKFKYLHSNSYSEKSMYVENPYFIDVEQLGPLLFKVNVYVYNNEKKTKKHKKVSAVITLEKAEFEYFLIKSDFLGATYIKERILAMLPADSKYYISKVEEEFSDGSKYTHINTLQTTDITLTIPETENK